MTVTTTRFNYNTKGKIREVIYDITATSGEGQVTLASPIKKVKGVVFIGEKGTNGTSGTLASQSIVRVSGNGNLKVTWTSAPPPETATLTVYGER
ncbi:MAG TPA: hypothetical protein VIH27_04115 [Nitrososphaerales archaeon]